MYKAKIVSPISQKLSFLLPIAEINLDKEGNMKSEGTYIPRWEAQGIKFNLYDKLNGTLLDSYISYNTAYYEICNFDGYDNIFLTNKTELKFKKSLAAQFFTSKEHFQLHINQFDIDTITENKKNLLTYQDIYDRTYDKMKGYDRAFLPDWRTTQLELTDEKLFDIKEKVISGFLRMHIKYMDTKDSVKKFVDEFQEKNTEYKYVRIFQPVVYPTALEQMEAAK
jgi:hypothetical protein